MPIFHKSKYLYIHIPKTAGTSIEEYLSKKEQKLLFRFNNKENLYSYVKMGKYKSSYQHLLYNEIIEIVKNIDDYKIFTVIRNPYDRIVSEYYFHLQKTKKWKVKDKDNKKDFLMFLKYYFNEKHDFDNHRLQQYRFIEGIDKMKLTILRFESLNEDFKNYFGEELLYHQNKTNKILGNYMNIFTEESKKIVEEYYKKDFELLEYKIL